MFNEHMFNESVFNSVWGRIGKLFTHARVYATVTTFARAYAKLKTYAGGE